MKAIPERIHQVRGNHESATKIAVRMIETATRAAASLSAGEDRALGPLLRGAHVREGDELLDAVIRAANAAKDDLRVAYCED